mmetsp:Transcript_9416/g.17426  ORF Transcript_9416/g.17426 Transcript_9416/m.17426 type:complete len:128 (+) Transcript_9416:186-569(+)
MQKFQISTHFLTTFSAVNRCRTSHTHSSEIFRPEAVEELSEKVLERATLDWEFQWPDGLLKSWHVIRAQGQEDKYEAMWNNSHAERKKIKPLCFTCWWASKGVAANSSKGASGVGAASKHAKFCTAR